MSSTSWVIRLLQDDKNTPILVKVSRKDGGHELDLDLLATDGDTAYTAKVRQRSLKKLRASSYDGTDEEWSNLLAFVLDPNTQVSAASEQRDNLDVTCSITGKGTKHTLSITFSNKIEEITQRLGTIELVETLDSDEVDLFAWAAQAMEQRDSLRGEIITLRERSKATEKIVSSLQKQIDELVEAKSEHEKQMFAKFTLLLNEKKFKIRNMQRILSTAKTDKRKLQELQEAIGDEPAGLAIRKKRRAEDMAQEDDDANDSEAYGAMDVEADTNVQQDPESPKSGNTTPTQSGGEDSDEDIIRGLTARPDPPTTKPAAQARQKEGMGQDKKQADKVEDDDETESEASEL